MTRLERPGQGRDPKASLGLWAGRFSHGRPGMILAGLSELPLVREMNRRSSVRAAHFAVHKGRCFVVLRKRRRWSEMVTRDRLGTGAHALHLSIRAANKVLSLKPFPQTEVALDESKITAWRWGTRLCPEYSVQSGRCKVAKPTSYWLQRFLQIYSERL